MKLHEIKELMQCFHTSHIQKFHLEQDGFCLDLEKAPVPPMPAAPAAAAEEVTVSVPPAPSAEEALPVGTPVTAPVVGVFYPASAPDAEPFVTVGQDVQAGQTLCIIEAMKMMNEVKAPVSGRIAAILPQKEDLVEFGQVLMVIEK